MVSAILIPVICIYFYWVTIKEMKEHDRKWLSLTEIHEEAIVIGQIVQLYESKKRFYYHRYVHIIEIIVQTETKTIPVKRITPFTKQNNTMSLKVGDQVRLYGNWQENEFRFLRIDVIK